MGTTSTWQRCRSRMNQMGRVEMGILFRHPAGAATSRAFQDAWLGASKGVASSRAVNRGGRFEIAPGGGYRRMTALRHMATSAPSSIYPELVRLREAVVRPPSVLGPSSQKYLQYAHHCVTKHLSPYWRAMTSQTLSALIHRAGNWLPSLPGVAYFHVPMLSALNTVGSNLPRTLAWIMVEIFRTGREVGLQRHSEKLNA